MKAAVLTVSDRVSRGEGEDLSGPLATSLLRGLGFDAADPVVVADGRESVAAALRELCATGVDVVITTGGTGISPRDQTPEGTSDILDRTIPGVAEHLRAIGFASTPMAALSRGLAGVRGRTVVINLAGSLGAVRDGIAAVGPILEHAVAQLDGGDH